MNRSKRKRSAFKVAIFSALAALTLYISILMASFFARLTPEEIRKALSSAETAAAVKLTVITATVSSIIALAIAVPVAFALSRHSFRGKAVIDTLLDIPIVLSPVAIGTAILLFFQTGAGQWVEGRSGPVVFSFAGIIIAQFTVVSALAVRLVKASFDEIPPRYGQVARVLGCAPAASFVKVELPLARKGIIAAWLLTWARAVGEFGATVTVAGATPFKTETLATGIYLKLSNVELGQTAVLVALMVAIAFAVLTLTRFAAGGRKGA